VRMADGAGGTQVPMAWSGLPSLPAVQRVPHAAPCRWVPDAPCVARRRPRRQWPSFPKDQEALQAQGGLVCCISISTRGKPGFLVQDSQALDGVGAVDDGGFPRSYKAPRKTIANDGQYLATGIENGAARIYTGAG
jgi:hypothetical protein